MRTTILSSLVLALTFAFYACDKEHEGNGKLVVRLTDAPGDFEQVLIDVKEIQIHTNSDSWQTLPLLNPGIYDLLDFTNGFDTLLVDTILPAGKISQMRLILGNNNSVFVDGEEFDLATPSAQQSGLKFSIQADIQEGIECHLWIDFDAAKSIVKKGNGSYSLKPVIRTFSEATSGAIKGMISPIESHPVVLAINAANDTISTFPNSESGAFLIRGLEAGTYTLVFEPVDGFIKKEINEIAVSNGMQTNMETIIIETSN